jgi:dynamin 1-like protein
LIAIQRAYINTNHPNFLGAAAAMSSVISSKQEKEKKAALAEERRKRDRRRAKEMGNANGIDTPEDGEEETEEKIQGIAIRQHASKESRSMSPAIRGMDQTNISASMNGARAGDFGSGAAGSTRDSFLNYFFGKEGGPNGANGSASITTTSMGTRHVSHNVEPSFSQSIRRQEPREARHSDRNHMQPAHDDYDSRSNRDYDYNSPYVSFHLIYSISS